LSLDVSFQVEPEHQWMRSIPTETITVDEASIKGKKIKGPASIIDQR